MNKNILSSDVEINGSIKFSQNLIIDGKIEGEILSGGDLTIGEHAVIKGNVTTRSVVILGEMNGNITVTDRCELTSTARLDGDVKAGTLAIQEGASFIGVSTVDSKAVPKRT